MSLIKSKEERKQIQESKKQKRAEYGQMLIDDFAKEKNLQALQDNDKRFGYYISENIDQIGNRAKGKPGEMAQFSEIEMITEQNWMIIKLLNEIKDELKK
jgi:hypothetical protein